MRTTALAFLMILFCGGIARADTYTITATANFIGGGFFGGALDFQGEESFVTQFNVDSVTSAIVPGTLTFSATGPLGTFSLVSGVSYAFYDWVNSTEDHVFQIDFGNISDTLHLGTFSGGDMDLDLLPSLADPTLPSSASLVVTEAPESSTFAFLLFSLAALLAVCALAAQSARLAGGGSFVLPRRE